MEYFEKPYTVYCRVKCNTLDSCTQAASLTSVAVAESNRAPPAFDVTYSPGRVPPGAVGRSWLVGRRTCCCPAGEDQLLFKYWQTHTVLQNNKMYYLFTNSIFYANNRNKNRRVFTKSTQSLGRHAAEGVLELVKCWHLSSWLRVRQKLARSAFELIWRVTWTSVSYRRSARSICSLRRRRSRALLGLASRWRPNRFLPVPAVYKNIELFAKHSLHFSIHFNVPPLVVVAYRSGTVRS